MNRGSRQIKKQCLPKKEIIALIVLGIVNVLKVRKSFTGMANE
jgi:hypothetical protein